MSGLFNEVGQAGQGVTGAAEQSTQAAKKTAKKALAPPPVTHAPPAQITSSPVRPGLPAVMGAPHPTLTNLAGTPTSVQDFNTRLEQYTQQSIATTGVKPKPADALAAALDPNLVLPQIGHAASVATQALRMHPAVDDKAFVDQLRQAVKDGTYGRFVTDNSSRIADLQQDPAWKGTVNGLIHAGAHSMVSTAPGSPSSAEPLAGKQAKVLKFAGQGSGVIDPTRTGTSQAGLAQVGVPVDIFGRAVSQVANSLVHAPAGVAEMVKTEVQGDVYAATHGGITHPFRPNPYFAKEGQIEKGFVTSTLEDIRNPSQRPGYLALDALGFGSLLFGAGARVAEAGRAVQEGEGATGAAKALVTAPKPKSATISKGAYSEQTPLSGNGLVAWLQVNAPVVGLRARQARADARVAAGAVGDSTSLLPRPLQWAANQLSFEKKIGRAGDARRRVEYQAAMAPKQLLDQAVGHATAQNQVLTHVPIVGRGLSRGEQKAIQIMSWDDPNPLEAERQFHEQAIANGVGDPKAHKQQLADLKLAEKTLRKWTPGDGSRFDKALKATAALMAENERLRIEELGLAPETAESRIARTGTILRGDNGKIEQPAHYTDEKLQAQIDDLHQQLGDNLATQAGPIGKSAESLARLQRKEAAIRGEIKRLSELKGLTPLERQSEASFYLPSKPLSAPGRASSAQPGFYRTGAGGFGMGPGASLPALAHEMRGDVIRDGNMRIDATNLAGESYGKTVKAVSHKQDWQKAWDAATPTPTSDADIAVRDIKRIPPELRDALTKLDDGWVTTDELNDLPSDMRKLIDELYVKRENLPADEIPHVRWIHPSVLGQSTAPPRLQGPISKAADYIYDYIRPLTFYVYPKYLLNKLGNDAMLIFDQGIWNAGGNIVRAMRADELYGEENAAKMRSIVGAGRQASYVTSKAGRANQALADFWNRWADRDERVAAFLHYARRLGYRTPAEIDQLLNQEANKADLLDASARAKKSLVEFDNLSPYEASALRHVLFVYPWVRGSFVWSIRSVFEHPAKTAILAKIGEQAENYEDRWLPQAPAWMRRVGYIPVAWQGSNPMVVDPSSINTFTTLGQAADVVRAGTEGDPYASAGDMLGPLATFLVHGATGRDAYGNPYAGSQWWGAAKQALEVLPLLNAIERHNRTSNEPGLKPFDVTKRKSLEARLNSALHQTVLTPGWLSGYGNLLGGGVFTPSVVNLNAAAARYWRDATPAQKRKRELDLLNRALTIQGQYLHGPGSRPPMMTLPGKTPGMLKPGNIDIANRPVAHNPDGSISTVRSITVTDDQGHAYLLPTVINGKVVSDEAAVAYWKKTGQNLGYFDSEKDADAYSIRLHDEQAKVYGKPLVPPAVRKAVKTQATLTQRYQGFATANGRSPTPKEKAGITLDYLASTGQIPKKELVGLRSQLAGLDIKGDITAYTGALLTKYGNYAAMHEWDADVRRAAATANPVLLTQKAQQLRKLGVPAKDATNVPAPQLHLYSLGYVSYLNARKRIEDGKSPTKADDLRTFDDQYNQPVNGLPSYTALRWASQKPQQQADAIVRASTGPWTSLSGFEKQIVTGTKVDPGVGEAWAAYREYLKAPSTIKQLKAYGQRSMARSQKLWLAKQLDKNYGLHGAFLRDYQFATSSLANRLKYSQLVRNSSDRGDWQTLLNTAITFHKQMVQGAANGSTTITGARDAWDTYTQQTLLPFLEKEWPALYRDLRPILAKDPKFLDRLIVA